jgi:DNA polymerase III subunit epsilon
MGTSVMNDEEFRATTFIVIDFEATTPTGYRPEPVDVAAVQLRVDHDRLVETGRFSGLMRPPAHAPVTRFDTEQTGITAAMVAVMPAAGEVLAALDATLTDPPYLLVAHNAPTEGGILYDYRANCPRLATTGFLDTVRLARVAYPELSSHRLDMLMAHLRIPRPADRHRALPDVEITVTLFNRILDDGARAGRWSTLRQLRQHGGYEAKAAQPRQESLFG